MGISLVKNPKILVEETVRSTAVGTFRISQPFSTVSLIYREPLGSRPHFKGRSGHGWVDSCFVEGCHDAFYEL